MSIHQLAESGDIEGLGQALREGQAVDARDSAGKTALHWAGGAAAAKALIAAGADVNAATDDGFTPLHSASRNGRASVVELLLGHGAKVGAKVKNLGLTPLHLAADSGRVEVAKILLTAGAAPNAMDWIGMTPLALAAEHGYSDLVDMLSSHGGVAALPSFG